MNTTTTSAARPSPVERRVEAPGAELFVRSVGGGHGGDTLVLVHGGPGISHEYLAGLEALAGPNLAIVSYDQRGVGRSTGNVSGAPLMQAVEDLEIIRQAIGADRIHLLGHSYGGLPAAAYAAAKPLHTKSLILVDSIPATGRALRDALGRQAALITELQQRGLVPAHLPSMETAPTDWLLAALPSYYADPHHPDARSLNGARIFPATMQATMGGLGDYDLRAELAGITAPILSFAARVPFGEEMADAMADALPKDRVKRMRLREGGHFPWIECPEPFFSEVHAFLRGQGLAGVGGAGGG